MEDIDVQKAAQLSRITLTSKEVEILKPQLSVILDYVKQIDRLDLSQTDPVSHPFNITNVFREDEPRPCLDREALLRIAPKSDKGMILVPKVIDSK